MGGWVNKWMDEWLNEWIGGWMNEWMGVRKKEDMERMDGWIEKEVNRAINKKIIFRLT